MVAAEDGDALRIADFEGDEEGYGLNGVVAAVYVIACNMLVLVGATEAGGVVYP